MKHKTLKLSGFMVALVLMSCIRLQAQDTLRINLPEAEKEFINKNLTLIAEKYNIDIGRAQVITAKLYNNPNLSLSGDLYNPQLKKFGDVSSQTGEYGVNLQQLIILAGKRNKQVRLAETNVNLAEQRFFDLLRTLRYSLRSDFYQLYYLQNSMSAYSRQLLTLEKMSNAFQDLQAKGVTSLKDAVRIKSLFYSLKADQANLQNQVNDLQSEIQLLLQNNKAYYIPQLENKAAQVSLDRLSLAGLIDTAYANRYDLRQAETNLVYSEQNYRLQKALAVPDLTLGASFDKRGSFVNNASFLNVAMDLPFFNRNQGNIKAAKISIAQGKAQLEEQKSTVENEVQHAYANLLLTDKTLQSLDPGFGDQFEKLLQAVAENFEKKNISLVEFTDFYESYKQNVIQFNQLQNQKMQAIEALHFAVGRTILNN